MEVFNDIVRIRERNPTFNLNIENTLQNGFNIIETSDKSLVDKEIDRCDYIAKVCASCVSKDPDFNIISTKYELKKINLISGFDGNNYLELIEKQYENEIISDAYYNFVKENPKVFDIIDEERNYKLDIFGLKTLERSYLLRENQEIKNIINEEKNNIEINLDEFIQDFKEYNSFKELEELYDINLKKTERKKNYDLTKIIFLETPQMVWLRVAIEIHGINTIKNTKDSSDPNEQHIERKFYKIKETYDILSNLYATHATPTLFNSGRRYAQLSSCYILDCEDDLDDLGNNLKKMMKISKYGGGLGLNLSKVRAVESLIRSNGGKASGVVSYCRMLDKVADFANQSGLRKGSIACYLEVWHAEIEDFVEMRTNTGNENMKARDLFFGAWTCSLFMKAVEKEDYWYLMSPNESKNLNEVYGEEFNKLYYKYVLEGKYVKRIENAGDLMKKIISCLIETGMPYFMFKDHINEKSNQKNIGIIKSSNLCTEIVEHTSQEEIAVCNLASLCLPKFVNNDGTFNYEELGRITRIITRNLNVVINANFYPTEETWNSNNKNRPVGLGVQGLADVYIKMNLSFESLEAMEVNKKIFECIYYHSLLESNELAKEYGHYKTFKGSPFSEGILQFHMWGKTLDDMSKELNYDWCSLIDNIKIYGTLNSLITSIMPTASTAQIMGNNESIEPYASNIYVRKTLSGEYLVVNKNLIEDLRKINMWDRKTYSELIYDNGSVQKLNIPSELKRKYKTAYEIKQSNILQQSADRGVFVDQTQSLNLFMEESSISKLYSCLMRGWKLGLKTGIYYLRTTPSVDADKFAIDIEDIANIKIERETLENSKKNKQNNDGTCLMCSA